MNAPVYPPLLCGRSVSGPVDARIRIDGEEYVNFFGTGYLALGKVAEIRNAVARELAAGTALSQQVPTSAMGGNDPIFDSVEGAAATACGTESAVYFASGYFIGTVGIASLEQPFGIVLMDEYAHYNLADAAKLSGLATYTFTHCDADSLHDTLKKYGGGTRRPLVLTDGVFATTGQIPPLADYIRILDQCGGHLLVDESHAFGVVGKNGRGATEFCGVTSGTTIGATLSKAFCAQGAFLGCTLAGSKRARAAPPIRGANAGSPLSAAAASASLSYMAARPEIRQNLSLTTEYLRMRLQKSGFEVANSPAPIVSFRVGKKGDMTALQKKLFNDGIFLHHSTYIGAGPEGLIRCAVFANHSKDDIDILIKALTR